jgi:hypothetical protein
MNDVTYVEAARRLAERMISEGGASADMRARRGYELVLGRAPAARETAAMLKALSRFESFYRDHPEDAALFVSQGKSPINTGIALRELAAWTGIASMILNTDEAITRE